MHVKHLAIPIASGSVFDVGRCQVAESGVAAKFSSTRRARAVASSISRHNHHEPVMIAARGFTGPDEIQACRLPGSS